MDFYYAVGTGLGHVQRACSFIEGNRLENIIVVTTNNLAKKILGNIPCEILPDILFRDIQTLKDYLLKLLQKYNIKSVYLDVFPGGLIGEWCGFKSMDLTFYLVSRIIKIEEYLYKVRCFSFPFFEKIFICEKISDEQFFLIKKYFEHVEITYVSIEHCLKPLKEKYVVLPFSLKSPFWIVIHSGCQEECEVLLKHAQDIAKVESIEPKLYLIHPEYQKIKLSLGVKKFSCFKLGEIVESAEKIITACGYNLMHELKPFKTKHIYVPFFRKYDNQYLRAKLFRQDAEN